MLITSELTNQSARKALFTCVVYTNSNNNNNNNNNNKNNNNNSIKAGVHLKAVFQLRIKLLMQISRLRFQQSRISMLISRIYVLGRCVNFLVIFRYIWR